MEWLSRIMPGYAPDGAPILSVLGKRTYKFAPGKTAWPDDEQLDFVEADAYYGQGNPQQDAPREESDLVAYKPMTDVVFIGKAHAPSAASGPKKVAQLDVGIQVAGLRKIVRVFGDRKAYVTGTGLAFSDAEAFSEMPLDFAHAYGGRDERSEPGFSYGYMKNPVGKGFAVKSEPRALQDLALPNLEDPQRPLAPQSLALGRFDRWPQAPEPVALGCIGKNTHPRFTYAGLAPVDWANAEADRQKSLRESPEVGTAGSHQPAQTPPRLNPIFFNGAAPGLRLPYLRGDEAIKLANLDPAVPQFAFNLPGARPKAVLDVGEGPEVLPMVLHTVVIHKETNQLTMTWRGCAYYGGLEAMKEFTLLEYEVED